jgi:hypothetical protein
MTLTGQMRAPCDWLTAGLVVFMVVGYGGGHYDAIMMYMAE